MVEIVEIDGEPYGGVRVKAKGITVNVEESEHYDETIFVYPEGTRLVIGTKNTRGNLLAGRAQNRWVCCLTKEETMAFIVHLLSLVREMD